MMIGASTDCAIQARTATVCNGICERLVTTAVIFIKIAVISETTLAVTGKIDKVPRGKVGRLHGLGEFTGTSRPFCLHEVIGGRCAVRRTFAKLPRALGLWPLGVDRRIGKAEAAGFP